MKLAAVCLVLLATATMAVAAPFSVGCTAGGTWNTVYAQGFSPSVAPSPDPGLPAGNQVALNQFTFYKSGTADTAANIRLAIISPFFSNLTGFSTSSSYFLGLSNNTVLSTAPLATGDPITFNFSGLPLTYGNGFGAVFVNESGGSLTPIRVSALTANYADAGGGDFHPTANYGTESQFQYATSNFINGSGFFSTFNYAGDANFTASFDSTVPEPASIGVLAGTMILATMARRRRRV